MMCAGLRTALYARAVSYVALHVPAVSLIGLTGSPLVQLVAHVWSRPVLLVAADVQEAITPM